MGIFGAAHNWGGGEEGGGEEGGGEEGGDGGWAKRPPSLKSVIHVLQG